MCRGSAGVCDPEEVCDGVNDDCPADLLAGTDVQCRPSITGDIICDPPEYCDGVNTFCPGSEEGAHGRTG